MSFSIQIEPEWNMIKKIKERIFADKYIKSKGRDFQDAVVLTAIELLENALKYSEGKNAKPVLFDLNIDENNCQIKVTNTCKNEKNIQALMSALENLRNGDAFAMYVERLEQLKDNPDGFSRMGLIRIGYEAEFQLEAQQDGDQLTITAKCKL